MRAIVDEAMEHIVDFIGTLPEQPSNQLDGAEEAARLLMEPLPEEGEPYEGLLERLFDEVIPFGFRDSGPG